MTLTLEQEEELLQILNALQENKSKLNGWELNFVTDQVARFDQYQSKLTLSPKQWAILRKIYEEKVPDAAKQD